MTETSGPRGRISLIKDVAQGRLDLHSSGFVEQMSQCLDCRACEAVCPSGVGYGQLVESARAQIRRAEAPNDSRAGRATREFLLRTLFERPVLLRTAARLLRLAQQTGLIRLAGRLGKLAPAISASFFTASGQRYDVDGAQGVAFLHAGCVMSVAFAGVHAATVRMLRRAGLAVVVPSDQGCCGAIAAHAGEPEIARAFAKRNIAAFERSRADVYVVNAAGCGSALKEYGQLLVSDPDWAQRAGEFSKRVRDISEVLDAMDLGTPSKSVDQTATYQEACHLVHAQRIAGAPRRLLARIPGLRLVEMAESALCCGSAGIYNLTQPEMASRLALRKVAAIEATGADVVVTTNPGCATQLTAALRDAGTKTRVKHLVELLDEAYGPS